MRKLIGNISAVIALLTAMLVLTLVPTAYVLEYYGVLIVIGMLCAVGLVIGGDV